MIIINKLFPTSNAVFHVLTSSFCFRNMENILKPPARVRGMTKLDKKLFEKEIDISCLVIDYDVHLNLIVPYIKKYLLKLVHFQPVEHASDKKIWIHLNPELITKWTSFTPEFRNVLNNLQIYESHLQCKRFVLEYKHFSVDDIFRAVLPTEAEGMSSFTKIGRIVHVNLREHLLPYKSLIGNVLFDKIPNCESVVNKTNMIDNTYRNFQMEVLMGDKNMLTEVKENNCKFKLDFSTVYWNSRLCTEHERIIKKLKQQDVLFDVFAGVGPFSIPAAKKRCVVHANDLNPEAYYWLNTNVKVNKIDTSYFKSYNKDGRDFIKEDIKKLLPKYLDEMKDVYITMNLPAMAVEFLNCFVKLFDENELPQFTNPPTVFVYCFAKGEDYVTITKNLVSEGFGFDVRDKIINIFKVRTVSSMKEMMRVAVRLDRDILIGNIPESSQKRKLEDSHESNSKRCHGGEDGKEPEENQQRLQSSGGEKPQAEVQSKACEN